MSGICGYVNFDKSPASKVRLEKMATAAKYRGMDGIFYWCQANVCFSYLSIHTTQESKLNDQPIVSVDGTVILVADARIDNREELASALEVETEFQLNQLSDARFILFAYQKWGVSCPEYLIGDFSFVIWDKRDNNIFAARDRLGNKPFYYRKTQNSLFWASEACQLLADPLFHTEIDKTMVARDLASPAHGGRHRSYYKGISKLGAAEAMTANAGGFNSRKYWNLLPAENFNYQTNEEYIEHFYELFSRVIYDRMRSPSTTGLFLSGGLDSASIAAVGKNEHDKNPEMISQFQAISFTNSRTPIANEYKQSRCVAAHLSIDYHEIDVAQYPLLTDFDQDAPHIDEPYCSHQEPYYLAAMSSMQSDKRPKVWMTGHPGDMINGGSNPDYFKSILTENGISALIDEMRAQSKTYNISLAHLFAEFFIKPIYLNPFKLKLKSFLLQKPATYYPWIDASLAQETNLVEWINDCVNPRFYHYDRTGQWKDGQKYQRCQGITWNQEVRMQTWFDRLAAQFGAEMWNPWNDFRLAEFVLRMPETLISQGLNNKLFFRDSVRHLLPESIVEIRKIRTGSGYGIMNDVKTSEFTISRIDSLFSTSNPPGFNFVDKKQLQHAMEQIRSGKKDFLFPLWIPINLQRWLQRHFL